MREYLSLVQLSRAAKTYSLGMGLAHRSAALCCTEGPVARTMCYICYVTRAALIPPPQIPCLSSGLIMVTLYLLWLARKAWA